MSPWVPIYLTDNGSVIVLRASKDIKLNEDVINFVSLLLLTCKKKISLCSLQVAFNVLRDTIDLYLRFIPRKIYGKSIVSYEKKGRI